MNIGLVGNRGHLEYVFEGLRRRPHVKLAAIASGSDDVEAEELQGYCQMEGHNPLRFPAGMEGYRRMLDVGGIGLVCIAGPFELHTPMCLEAFSRGVHVFCEKPVSITLAELAELKEGYRANSKVQFSAMMGLRYAPAFYTAWELVRSGTIGQVRLLNAQKSYKLGERPAYYRQRQTYGGTIPWVGSHAIDWVYWFSQARFQSVRASQSRQANRGNGSLEVSALCQFRLAGEILASVSIDYLRPATAETHGDDRLRVAGTGGVVEVRQGKVFLIRENGDSEQKIVTHCERQVFSDFIDQVEGRQAALLSADDIFRVTEACLLAQQSADEEREIAF
jgi:predicted dehydrogenase